MTRQRCAACLDVQVEIVHKAKVRRVESHRSIADLLPDWRLAEVREGDQVLNLINPWNAGELVIRS